MEATQTTKEVSVKLYSTKINKIINIKQKCFFKALDRLETLKNEEPHLQYKYHDKYSALNWLFTRKVINKPILSDLSYDTITKLNIKGA